MNKLEFIIVCESAFLSQGNLNLNLINIFDSIGTVKFPAVHPKFYVVTSVKTDQGSHELRLVIKKNNIILAEPKASFTGEKHRWINMFVNVVFPEPGVYPVELYLDGGLLGNTNLNVTAAEQH